MKLYLKVIILFVFFVNFFSVLAQQDLRDVNDFNLYNTQYKLINSQFVDDTFHVFIGLPDNYNSTDKKYPVIYVLDGDISYGMASGIARYLEIGGNIPKLIVVGIGYGAVGKGAGNKRNRDYRPKDSGGAESFQKFIKEELIPYVDNNYRTVKDNRTIAGYSLGGLFALYSLFTQPGTFQKYIAGSPYLLPGNFVIFDYEAESVSVLNEISARLFISVGSEASNEKYFNPIDELVTKMQEHDYPDLIIETKVFDGSNHLVGPPEVLTHGLVSVFKE
jgi:predicted alpha/beta superfamily hydrolase